jgi:hypothetical protein
MEVCYWALLFMPLVILHHLLNVFVQLANKRGFTKKKIYFYDRQIVGSHGNGEAFRRTATSAFDSRECVTTAARQNKFLQGAECYQ